MMQGFRALSFLAGVATGAVLANTPAVRAASRALMRKAIKTGIVLQREFQAAAEQVREDWEDTLAEVRAELDEEKDTEPQPQDPHGLQPG